VKGNVSQKVKTFKMFLVLVVVSLVHLQIVKSSCLGVKRYETKSSIHIEGVGTFPFELSAKDTGLAILLNLLVPGIVSRSCTISLSQSKEWVSVKENSCLSDIAAYIDDVRILRDPLVAIKLAASGGGMEEGRDLVFVGEAHDCQLSE
jgi:hypothetical protein